jgi:hypothetical protein
MTGDESNSIMKTTQNRVRQLIREELTKLYEQAQNLRDVSKSFGPLTSFKTFSTSTGRGGSNEVLYVADSSVTIEQAKEALADQKSEFVSGRSGLSEVDPKEIEQKIQNEMAYNGRYAGWPHSDIGTLMTFKNSGALGDSALAAADEAAHLDSLEGLKSQDEAAREQAHNEFVKPLRSMIYDAIKSGTLLDRGKKYFRKSDSGYYMGG